MRNKQLREIKSKVVIMAEGKNKTEKQYFSHYKTRRCNIDFCSSNETDITGMLEKMIAYITKNDIKILYGDSLYLVIDLDDDINKYNKLLEIKPRCDSYGIQIIASNSSFELWLLLHFNYSTKSFNNKELINELKKHIKGYTKSLDVYPLLEDKIAVAIENNKKLEKHQKNNDMIFCNPYTNVYKIALDLVNRNAKF